MGTHGQTVLAVGQIAATKSSRSMAGRFQMGWKVIHRSIAASGVAGQATAVTTVELPILPVDLSYLMAGQRGLTTHHWGIAGRRVIVALKETLILAVDLRHLTAGWTPEMTHHWVMVGRRKTGQWTGGLSHLADLRCWGLMNHRWVTLVLRTIAEALTGNPILPVDLTTGRCRMELMTHRSAVAGQKTIVEKLAGCQTFQAALNRLMAGCQTGLTSHHWVGVRQRGTGATS
ncbi:unnamed protein product (mitochondrion) [Plasmodiophora brassicae]|uniref:Uncharacterized protein n=1 Tax=Plasmodiophora brassicae TaxID=37360 RepID=A0A0G4IZF0_PLABS|nr:hypothetical protein PBRA_001656 [Plasmodiophora brassicae]SPQ93906.1 unnamed protein product [Plasmodiophora brassicae]